MKTQRINSDSIPTSKGTYLLFLSNTKSQKINIGKQGDFQFTSGLLVYVGSAFGSGGLRGRVSHHLRINRKCHWHIDYLLNDKNAKITEVHKFEKEECILNQETCGEIIVTGFGSSDCKNKCKSHLKYLG